jgi:hypothetical protein
MTTVVDGSAGVTTNSGAIYNGIASGTAVASTSGTSIDFTGIPSWVKRITVMFAGVSTSGTSNLQIQIGSGSVTTSGYASETDQAGTGLNATSGFLLTRSLAATTLCSGVATLSLIGSNSWVVFGTLGQTNNSTGSFFAGSSGVLGGALDRVRITTVNGTDTFDAGSINILYE